MGELIWKDTEQVPGSGQKTGLMFERKVPQRAGLYLTVSRSRRLCIRSDERVLMWVRLRKYSSWTRMCTLLPEGQPLRIVAPITAYQARNTHGVEDWTRWFARELAASKQSPIGEGKWELTKMRYGGTNSVRELVPMDQDELPTRAEGLFKSLSLPRCYHTDWDLGPLQVLPLRLGSNEGARVQAWQKHVRDRTLPPVLLMWLRGLQSFIILDGHDRLAACIKENRLPDVLVLWQLDYVEYHPDSEHYPNPDFLAAYEQAFANERMSGESRAEMNRQLNDYYRMVWRGSFTTARATTNDATWDAEVSRELAGDKDLEWDLDWMMGPLEIE